jgi:N-acetylmuramoyl-L-alanine amidase
LEYVDGAAIYRLKAGEALYSAVVVRFTGLLHAADVNATAAELARLSGIADVTDIAIGFPVRIPFELLLPEFLPAGHPRRLEWERSQEEVTAIQRAIRARNLDGIHIILDAGHGGVDTGAIVKGVWESTYAWDVMDRVKRILEKETRATVWATGSDQQRTPRELEMDVLPARRTQRLLVDPPFDLSDSTTGVHLRWVLGNAIVRRLKAQQVDPERVAFVSIHADSLHPSVRGLMVYVPGRADRPALGSPRPSGHACRELQEVSRPRFSSRQLARSEALSRQLALAVVGAARRADILVHPYEPVRGAVVRRGSRWVPAVLRNSEAPSALLVEICNLANDEDRAQILSWRFRDKLAHAIAAGLAEGFAR